MKLDKTEISQRMHGSSSATFYEEVKNGAFRVFIFVTVLTLSQIRRLLHQGICAFCSYFCEYRWSFIWRRSVGSVSGSQERRDWSYTMGPLAGYMHQLATYFLLVGEKGKLCLVTPCSFPKFPFVFATQCTFPHTRRSQEIGSSIALFKLPIWT